MLLLYTITVKYCTFYYFVILVQNFSEAHVESNWSPDGLQ